MLQLSQLQRILARLEKASLNVCRNFACEKYVMPQKREVVTESDIISQINKHIMFLENREFSHIMFKREK